MNNAHTKFAFNRKDRLDTNMNLIICPIGCNVKEYIFFILWKKKKTFNFNLPRLIKCVGWFNVLTLAHLQSFDSTAHDA